MGIAVLMTCHNRVETTHSCLARLMPQLGNDDRVFLVDDGSMDGTGAKVSAVYPTVSVIEGNGKLFWAKGMRKAWEAAVAEVCWDYYLWLNDDVMLKSDALSGLRSDYTKLNSTSVLVGACEYEGQCTYSGTDSKDRKLAPNGQPQSADGWLNGNVVLVPKDVFGKVGMISPDYTHARADYDYAERLKLAGIPFYVSSGYVGSCPFDFNAKMRGKGFAERVSMLWKPGYFNLHDLYLIRRRYHGHIAAIASCARLIQIVLKGWK